MLNTPTLEKLYELNFTGMIKALEEQIKNPEIEALSSRSASAYSSTENSPNARPGACSDA